MPLIPAGRSTPGFGNNVATEVNAGKPQKQAVAIAYSEAKKANAHDARPASVRVLGEDPKDQQLTAIPRQIYAQAAGQPWAMPSTIGEPASMSIVSKTPHEAATVTAPAVIPSEPLVRVVGTNDDDYSSAPEGSASETGDPFVTGGEGAPASSQNTTPSDPGLGIQQLGSGDSENENVEEAECVNRSPPTY